MTPPYSTDIVIFGGGIAGLWLLNRLRNEGYQAILFESNDLGGGQTIASQGIIHGGLKYALSGSITGAANANAEMPGRWRECIAGTGDVDLTGCHLLNEHYYMWSDSGFRSRLKTFLGSKSLRGRVEAVDSDDYPAFFKQATVEGVLYRLPDFVVNTDSLIRVLAKNQYEHIFKIDDGNVEFRRNDADKICAVTVRNRDQALEIEVQYTVFCAGEGNKGLIEQAGLKTPRSQIRPLKMVYVKKSDLSPVYVHCIGNNFSLTPRLTVTSHVDINGLVVWYLGGELAEAGTSKSNDEQLEIARALISELFPWQDLEGAEWNCFTVNRAEANINNNYRPDDAFIIEEHNVIAAWPTKLTLTPSLADKLVECLAENSVIPKQKGSIDALSSELDRPKFATAYWD